MSKHPGPQAPPDPSHYDCAGVNCTHARRKLDAHWMGTIRAQLYGELRQFVTCTGSTPLETQAAFARLCQWCQMGGVAITYNL